MSEILSIRVPRKLKEKMRKYNIDWAEEIRKFLEARVRSLELLELLDEIEDRAKERTTRIDTTTIIREEREKH